MEVSSRRPCPSGNDAPSTNPFLWLSHTEETDRWTPPKPWSPKPLTPLQQRDRPSTTSWSDNPVNHYYGQPQVDWTPPRLPACAHSTPHSAISTPDGRTDTTSSPRGHAPAANCSLGMSSSSDTSGYSSGSAGGGGGGCGNFAFSPTTLNLESFDDSFTPLAVHLSHSPLSSSAASSEGGTPLTTEENMRITSPSSVNNVRDNEDIIYTGTSFLEALLSSNMQPFLPSPSPASTVSSSPPTPEGRPVLSSDTRRPETEMPAAIQVPQPASPILIDESSETDPFPSGDAVERAATEEPAPGGESGTGSKKQEVEQTGHQDGGVPPAKRTKPKEPYFSIIAKVILEAPERRLILADIYDTVQYKYPYFQTADTSWRNVVRHNLSVNDCFMKAGRAESGRGFYWGIHPSCVDLFKKGDFRRREAKRLVQLYQDGQKAPTVGKENLTPVSASSNLGSTATSAGSCFTYAAPRSTVTYSGNLQHQGVMISSQLGHGKVLEMSSYNNQLHNNHYSHPQSSYPNHSLPQPYNRPSQHHGHYLHLVKRT